MTGDESRDLRDLLEALQRPNATLSPELVMRCTCRKVQARVYVWKGIRILQLLPSKIRHSKTGEWVKRGEVLVELIEDGEHWAFPALCRCGSVALYLCHEADLPDNGAVILGYDVDAWAVGQAVATVPLDVRGVEVYPGFCRYAIGHAVAAEVHP